MTYPSDVDYLFLHIFIAKIRHSHLQVQWGNSNGFFREKGASQVLKRPCRYIFPHFRYTFSRPPFFGLIHWFRAKTTWEAHPTGFLGPKKGILGFPKFFFEKSWIFRAKRNFFIYLYFLSPNVLKVIPDIIYSYFYHTSPFKRV